MSESALMKATLDLARLMGWRIARFPMLNLGRDGQPRKLAYDTKGFWDTILVRDRLIVVEFKNADRDLTAEQEEWVTAYERANVECYVFRPEHWHSGAIESVLR